MNDFQYNECFTLRTQKIVNIAESAKTMCKSDIRKIEFAMQIETESTSNVKRWSRSWNNVQGNWQKVETSLVYQIMMTHIPTLKITSSYSFTRLHQQFTASTHNHFLCFISSHHHNFTVQQHLKQENFEKNFPDCNLECYHTLRVAL